MPEVKDLSEALPETSMDPITGVGVVASRNRAPTGYDVVSPDPLIQPMFIPCAQEPPSLMCKCDPSLRELEQGVKASPVGRCGECPVLGVRGPGSTWAVTWP